MDNIGKLNKVDVSTEILTFEFSSGSVKILIEHFELLMGLYNDIINPFKNLSDTDVTNSCNRYINLLRIKHGLKQIEFTK